MPKRLTQSIIPGLKPGDKPYWITDSETQNLKLYVGTSGKKVWYLFFRNRDKDGKKDVLKLGTTDALTVAQAREMAKDVGGRIVRGENVKEQPTPKLTLTFGEFLQKYYEPWVVGNRRTGKETIKILARSFSFLFSKPVEDFTILEIEQWRTKRKNEGRKAATINRQITALKASINWGIEKELIKLNPFTKLRSIREDDSNRKIRYLSPDEGERLYAALDTREERIRAERDSHNKWLEERGHPLLPNLKGCAFADHLKPMVIVSLNTGIRRGSLFQLVWSDINFKEENLTIRPLTDKSGKLVHVPLNPDLKKTLLAWKEQTGCDGDELVFPSPKTGKILDNCRKAWKGTLMAADIKNFTWHDMRHDFASQLVMKGVDLNTVRELMGHSDIKMTLRYAHLAPQVKRAAVDLLTREK